MFFGHVISQNKPFAFTPENVGEQAGEVLSLTNVVLAPSSKVNSFFISGRRIIVYQKG